MVMCWTAGQKVMPSCPTWSMNLWHVIHSFTVSLSPWPGFNQNWFQYWVVGIKRRLKPNISSLHQNSTHTNSYWSHKNFLGALFTNTNYRKISNIRFTKSQNFNVSHLSLKLSLRNILKPSLSEGRCSWSSANRRCSNFIWVTNNSIAY